MAMYESQVDQVRKLRVKVKKKEGATEEQPIPNRAAPVGTSMDAIDDAISQLKRPFMYLYIPILWELLTIIVGNRELVIGHCRNCSRSNR
jgi:hypothetical protein